MVKVISLPYIFQVLFVLCFTRPRYQVSVYRTTCALVLLFIEKIYCGYSLYENHLLDESLMYTLSDSFYEDISKEFSDSFYCISFLLVIGLKKIRMTPQDRKNN